MATREYAKVLECGAPRGAVWNVLADVQKWPEWTPTMTSVRALGASGLTPGNKFEVKQPGLAKAVFTVDACVEGTAFAWSTRSAGVSTLADHVLSDTARGGTRVELSIRMSGPGVGLLWMLLGRKVRSFVDTEAESLAAAVVG